MDDKLLQQKLELKLEQPIEKKEIEFEDIEKMETLFTMLKFVPNEHLEKLKVVVGLIQEMSHIEYNLLNNYEMMWKIIKIGELMNLILPEQITNNVTAKNINDGVKDTANLQPKEQYVLFKVARNMSADGFHHLDENETKKFIKSFSSLCRG